jgi:hypothetical protein
MNFIRHTFTLLAVILADVNTIKAQDPLPSWNDTAPKKAIVAFVEKVTKEGSPDFEVYGIPPEQVIGSSGKLKFEIRDGIPALVKLPAVDFIDDKGGKPVGIQSQIGRRPIAAFGNSDGDLQMLQWTAAGPGARFCLYIHHTDAEREWAYDRKSHIGTLDQGLNEAAAKGWTVVSMKDDWKTIFAAEK